jgi:hypothetical protein
MEVSKRWLEMCFLKGKHRPCFLSRFIVEDVFWCVKGFPGLEMGQMGLEMDQVG